MNEVQPYNKPCFINIDNTLIDRIEFAERRSSASSTGFTLQNPANRAKCWCISFGDNTRNNEAPRAPGTKYPEELENQSRFAIPD